jgi:hypothetical protein
VSCKYLSRIVVNASPAHLFDRLLAGGYGKRGSDWFGVVAPAELSALYDAVRSSVALTLPDDVAGCDVAQRRALATELRAGWPSSVAPLYDALCGAVAGRSAARWQSAIANNAERLLWRMLRIGSAPYYVLGVAADDVLRMRIATPWDWRQRYELCEFNTSAGDAGQPVVRWRALVRDRATRDDIPVEGHVEVRWSHGRFSGPPEAKVYLDTPHRAVPGYFPLV